MASDLNYIVEHADDDQQDDDEDDNDEEPITAQKVLEILQTTWINERLCPDILVHQTEMLELMLGQIAHMEENLKHLNKNDFRRVSHQMELDRIRYIICSYLRCRLQKIECFTQYILMEEEKRTVKRLSVEEQRYAETYFENLKKHFQNVALQHMPYNLQQDDNIQIIRPNLMSHVFLKANRSVAGVVVGVDDEEVDLDTGSQHIMPYQLAADLLHDGHISLI